MDLKIKPHFIYLLLVLSIPASSLFSGCTERTSEVDTKSSEVETDSILTWVTSGRDANNPNLIRQEYLLKAYERTKSIKVDSLKLKYLSKIQWSFLNLEDSLWFRKTNKETNELSEKVGDSLRLAGALWDLGVFLDRNSVKDSAYFSLSKAQKMYGSLGEQKKAGILAYEMGRIQANIKDYSGSEISTIKAIEFLKPLQENLWLFNCYNMMGIVAKDLREYDRSLEYYSIANNYLQKSGQRGRFSNNLENNIGVNYLVLGEYEKAISYFEKNLNQDSLQIKYPEYYARTLNNLAESQYRLNAEADVEEIFLESLKIRDSIEDFTGLAGGHFNLAKYYTFKKDISKAIASAKKSITFAEQSSNNERLLESLELLTQLEPQNASTYSQKYIALSDSLSQEERKIRNKFARIRFETDEVVAENELLARQKQLWAGIAISVLLLGTAGYVIVDQRAKNQKLKFQREQQLSDEKIFNLMLSEKQKFEEGKKIEQKRISEELHDGILGKMLGARMVLTGLNKKADDEAISERADAIAALKDVEGEVRTISHEMSHAAYQEIHNFIRSIRDLLKNTTEAADIKHIFNYDEEVEWDDLRGDIKINLYRMVQESLQNAIKHAQCQNINVDFSTEKKELKVLIEDDGVGFVLNKKKRKGIGMRNLQSRISKLNGKLHIDSKQGEGTAIRLSIPIEYFSKDPQIIDELVQV